MSRTTKEAPRAASATTDELLKIGDLQLHPGRWTLLARGVASEAAGEVYRRHGCEVGIRKNTAPPSIDLFGRWPELPPLEEAPVQAVGFTEPIRRRTEAPAPAPEPDPTPEPPAQAPTPEAPPTPPAAPPPPAPSAADLEAALITEAERYGIQFPGGYDFTDPKNAKLARERIALARDRARRSSGPRS